MAGRFPKLVTPGYSDDSPLSFPLRRWVDRPPELDTLRPSKRTRRELSALNTPDPWARSAPRPVDLPLGDAVGRRKYANGNILFYGYPSELVAQWCGVSLHTANLYKTGARKPSRQALRLFVLHRDGRVLGPEWREWSVKKDVLVSPEGQETTHGQLNAYWLIMQLARELARDNPKATEEFYRILGVA